MAKITDMPVELLEIIFLFEEDSLTICAQVSKQFNAVATRLLYRTVILRNRSMLWSAVHLHAFARTIIGRPPLGEYVRNMSVGLQDIAIPVQSRPDDLPDYVAVAQSHGLSSEVLVALSNHSPDAIIFLLFCYLPRLRHIDISAMQCGYLLPRQVLSFRPLPAGLQSLESVAVTGVLTWDLALPFLAMPSLNTFKLYALGDWLGLNVKSLIPPGVSTVQCVELSLCAIPTALLRIILPTFHNLRTLKYNYEEPTPGPGRKSVALLGDVLRAYSLTTLEYFEFTGTGHRRKMGILGSLADFDRLTYISLPLWVLLDSDPGCCMMAGRLSALLPESLLSLSIQALGTCRTCFLMAIQDLVKSKRGRLGYFRHLVVRSCFWIEELDSMQLACEAEGVRFGWE